MMPTVLQDINHDANLGALEHGLTWSRGDEKRSWVTLPMWLMSLAREWGGRERAAVGTHGSEMVTLITAQG